MTTLAHESTEYATPPAGDATSGCQQAASQSVIGYDPATTLTLDFQAIGQAVVEDGCVEDV